MKFLIGRRGGGLICRSCLSGTLHGHMGRQIDWLIAKMKLPSGSLRVNLFDEQNSFLGSPLSESLYGVPPVESLKVSADGGLLYSVHKLRIIPNCINQFRAQVIDIPIRMLFPDR